MKWLVHGECSEGVRGAGSVLRGLKGEERKKRTEIELFASLFWAPLPLLQMSIHSPLSSKCWGCRWPTEESTYQSPAGHPPICLPIYSSAHLMTILPVRSTLLLLLLHLSHNQSINISICAPIQQFITPPIYLPVIHLFVFHPSVWYPSILAQSYFHVLQAASPSLLFTWTQLASVLNLWVDQSKTDKLFDQYLEESASMWLNNPVRDTCCK